LETASEILGARILFSPKSGMKRASFEVALLALRTLAASVC
jgi:hypothetical protein